jgi:hypothetical protein
LEIPSSLHSYFQNNFELPPIAKIVPKSVSNIFEVNTKINFDKKIRLTEKESINLEFI